MNADFKKVPVDDRLSSIKESLSLLHDEPTKSFNSGLDKATVSDFVAYGSDLSYSAHAELLEDWERIEQQPAEEKSLLRELEEDFRRQEPPSDRPTEAQLAEKEKSLSLLRTAYHQLLTRHQALEKKYKALQRAYHKQAAESQKQVELDALRDKNRALAGEMRDLKIELRRRPPRKVLDETKSKIKQLENLIDLPRCISPLGRNQDLKLLQTLATLLQTSSVDALPRAVKAVLARNAKYEQFRNQLLDLIAEHSPDVALPSMKRLFKWIRRLFEEYISLKKQTRAWKEEQGLLRLMMKEVGVVSSTDLLSAVRNLSKLADL